MLPTQGSDFFHFDRSSLLTFHFYNIFQERLDFLFLGFLLWRLNLFFSNLSFDFHFTRYCFRAVGNLACFLISLHSIASHHYLAFLVIFFPDRLMALVIEIRMTAFNTPFPPCLYTFLIALFYPIILSLSTAVQRDIHTEKKESNWQVKKKGEKGQKGGVMGHVPSVRIRALICVDT